MGGIYQPFSLLNPSTDWRSFASESLVEDVYPATPFQQNVLYITKSQPSGRLYTSIYHLSLPPQSDITHLREAWDILVSQVPILRTAFCLSEGSTGPEVFAIVYKPGQGPHPEWIESVRGDHDAVSMTTEGSAFVERLSFDPFNGELPLVAHVVGSPKSGYHVRVCLHHALYDGAAGKSIIRSLHRLYINRRTPLLGTSFAPAAALMLRQSNDGIKKEGAQHWQQLVKGTTGESWPLCSPIDPLLNISMESISLPVSISSGNSENAPAFRSRIARTALALAISLHSGMEDTFFVENRNYRPFLPDDMKVNAMGPFLFARLVRMQCCPDCAVASLLSASIDEERDRHIDRAGMTLGEILDAIGSKAAPKVGVYLTVHSTSYCLDESDVPGWNVLNHWTYYDAPLNVDVLPPRNGSADVRIIYNPAKIQNHVDVSAFAEHFAEILVILSRPDAGSATIADVFRELSQKDKLRTLDYGRGLATPDENELASLLAHERVSMYAKATPFVVALDFEAKTTMTYAELEAHASQLATELVTRGVKADVMVPILFDVSFDMIIALLAVMKAGGAYVPLALDNPKARWEKILRTVNARFLLCSADIASRPDVTQLQTSLSGLEILKYSHQSFSASPHPLSPSITEKNLAYVFFTSGSTGTPKGVAVEHKNLRAFLNARQGNATSSPGMRKLLLAPYTFDISVGDIFSTLTSGGTLGLVGRDELLSDLPGWLDVMKPTHLGVTPSVGRQIPTEGLPHLTHILFCGETLPVELALRLSRTRQVSNIMGPTEATIDVTEYKVPHSSGMNSNNPFGERVPIGYPAGQTTIYILRPGTLDLVVRGEVGEICIGGPQVARGYIGDEELSKVKFVPDPFANDGGRMFRTGDVGRWNQFGQLEHFGRIDGQVKLHGLRIETGEVEFVMERSHNDFRGVYVDVVNVGGDQAMVALFMLSSVSNPIGKWVVSSTDENVIEAIKSAEQACKTNLPKYMKPSIWLCVTHFPRTSSGKTDRAELRRIVEEHLSTTSMTSIPAQGKRHPFTNDEIAISELVSKVVNLPISEIDLDSSFLAHGGNSLQAMRLSASLRGRGYEANISDILDDQVSIAKLAVISTHGGAEEDVPYHPFILAPNGWEESLKPLKLQRHEIEDVFPVDVTARDWFQLALDHEGRALLTQHRYDLGEDIDPGRFEWAWEQLRWREPALRTVLIRVVLDSEQQKSVVKRIPFANSLGLMACVLRPEVKERGPFLDVASVKDAGEVEAAITKVFAEHRAELGIVPIHSLLIFNKQERKWTFASTRHHVIHDSRSMNLQAEELGLLYHEGESAIPIIEGRRSVATSYGAFMYKSRSPARIVAERPFWQKYLEGIDPPAWPSVDDVPLSFFKDFAGYGIHIAQWMGNLGMLAKKLGVTKGALARSAYAIALAEKEGRRVTAIYEIVDGLSGMEMNPYGFCTVYHLVKVQTAFDASDTELERYIKVVKYIHKSFTETLPYRSSGCDMAAEIVGPRSKPGQHFATALLNIFDLTESKDPSTSAGTTENALQQKFLTTEQSSYVGVNLPLNIVYRIMNEVTVFICPHDLSLVSKEEIDKLVQRAIRVLDVLKQVL